MKFGRSVIFVGILASLAAVPRSPALPQSTNGSPVAAKHSATAKQSAAAFEPLARWRAAVLAGDKTALAALYSTVPPAATKTSQGQSQDPNLEVEYWAALKPRGLSSFT